MSDFVCKEKCKNCPDYSLCLDEELMRAVSELETEDKAWVLYFTLRLEGLRGKTAASAVQRVWDKHKRKNRCRCCKAQQ